MVCAKHRINRPTDLRRYFFTIACQLRRAATIGDYWREESLAVIPHLICRRAAPRPTDEASNFARMSLSDKTLDLEIAQHVLLREHADFG